MVQSILAKPLPLVCHDFEDQKTQEFNNTSDPQDEDLIELCIKEVHQSWDDCSEGRSTPDSSASPRDPFTEVASAASGVQGIDYTSVIPNNITQSFTNTGSFQLIPENGAIAGDPNFEPIQGENEVDLATIFDLFLMEEQDKLDPPKCQAINDKSQANGVKSQADPSVVKKNTTYDSSLRETTLKHGRWKHDEHDRFLQGIEKYGRQWQRISLLVGTRSPTQVRTHAQKHFLNDPELEEKSKCPERRRAKRQRVSYDSNFRTTSNFPNNGHWSEDEHDLFLQGVQEHGRNWVKIAALVQSRTVQQTRSHAQKHFQKIEKSREKASI